MKKYIIKIGGSIATNRYRYCELNHINLERIGKEIGLAYNQQDMQLVILIGAGSFGHLISHEYNLHKGFTDKKQLCALRNVTCNMWELANILAETLSKNGMPTYCFHTPSYLISDNSEVEELFFKPIEYCINLGVTPILWGDINFDRTMKFTNVSGDKIAVYITKYFKADKVLMFSDVDGIMQDYGSEQEKIIKRIDDTNYKQALQEMRISNKIDISGGMKVKLESLSKLIGTGIMGFVGNGNKDSIIYDVLMGNEALGTYIY